MAELLKDAVVKNPWFYIMAGLTVGLLVAGFIAPPTGQIDPSVLKGSGVISFWGLLGVVLRAIDKGVETSVKHKDTEISVKGKRHNEQA